MNLVFNFDIFYNLWYISALEGPMWWYSMGIWGLRSLGGNRCMDVRTDRRTYGNSPLCPTWHQPFGDAAQKSDKKQPLRYYFVWGGGRAEECGWGWTRNLFNLPMDFISFSNSKEPKICDQSNQNDKKLTFFHLLLEFPTDLWSSAKSICFNILTCRLHHWLDLEL